MVTGSSPTPSPRYLQNCKKSGLELLIVHFIRYEEHSFILIKLSEIKRCVEGDAKVIVAI